MTRSVLVVGHADADGHLIAEQVRRNLDLVQDFEVDVLVDPARTQNHKAWLRLDSIVEIEKADIVFFVDLMFAPATFAQEARSLVNFVASYPEKQFFLIDHHPLPLQRLGTAENLRAIYRPDVFDCAIGPRSGMMVVAALCENQAGRVKDIKQPIHDILAVGMRRAAAHGGELPGRKLMALLRHNCWEALERLGNDNKQYHKLPRGRRPSNQPESVELRTASDTASELLAEHLIDLTVFQAGEIDMVYNVDRERYYFDSKKRERYKNQPAPAKDLEAIVTLLEMAAIMLTKEPHATFSVDDLIREAKDIGGEEISIDDRDIKIVLEKATFVERVGGELRLK